MAFTMYDIERALAETFFAGDQTVAGVAIFGAIMAVLFVAFGRRNVLVPFAIMLPAVVVFSAMGLIPSALSIILCLVSVLVIAAKAKEAL